MLPRESVMTFKKQLEKANIKIENVYLNEVIDQCIQFYQITRCEKVDLNNDGDMILVQWGSYDWGSGRYFEFDITRQFIEIGKEGDDAFSQFRFTLYYPPDIFDKSVKGNKWFNNPNNCSEIKKYILQLPIYNQLKSISPIKREVNWGMI